MEDRTAIVTGGSRGLGLALVRALHERGWRVVTDGRDAAPCARRSAGLAGVVAVPGDVTSAAHRAELVAAAGTVDLVVNNAGGLGPSPLPPRRLPARRAGATCSTSTSSRRSALIQAAAAAPRRRRGASST